MVHGNEAMGGVVGKVILTFAMNAVNKWFQLSTDD
jgi:hypothetical protein